MNAPAGNLAPAMKELNVSNALLGDRSALEAAWDRDGYWFFRDVLDRKVIDRIRGIYVDYLVEEGVAERDDPLVRYNGADLSDFSPRAEPLVQAQVYRELHEAPTILAFFRELFGVEPFWLPFTEYRTTPPATDGAKLFNFIHADADYNYGLPFIICWVPLAEIGPDVGGLALVEGVHKQPSLHKVEGLKIHPINLEDVPADAWRRSNYQPGDVLLIDRATPHSGLSNRSDRFRLSMDTRIMPTGADNPFVGEVVQISANAVTLRDTAGDHHLRLHEGKSFVRWLNGDPMNMTDVPKRYKTGDWVIASAQDGVVCNMRPRH